MLNGTAPRCRGGPARRATWCRRRRRASPRWRRGRAQLHHPVGDPPVAELLGLGRQRGRTGGAELVTGGLAQGQVLLRGAAVGLGVGTGLAGRGHLLAPVEPDVEGSFRVPAPRARCPAVAGHVAGRHGHEVRSHPEVVGSWAMRVGPSRLISTAPSRGSVEGDRGRRVDHDVARRQQAAVGFVEAEASVPTSPVITCTRRAGLISRRSPHGPALRGGDRRRRSSALSLDALRGGGSPAGPHGRTTSQPGAARSSRSTSAVPTKARRSGHGDAFASEGFGDHGTFLPRLSTMWKWHVRSADLRQRPSASWTRRSSVSAPGATRPRRSTRWRPSSASPSRPSCTGSAPRTASCRRSWRGWPTSWRPPSRPPWCAAAAATTGWKPCWPRCSGSVCGSPRCWACCGS